MYKSILKMSVVSLVFLGNVTMGCDHKNTLIIPKPDRIKNLPSETKEYLVDRLDNPIVFGQTDKENHGLVKYQGWRNICLAYQKKDPNFFLFHYVPVFYIDTSCSRNRLNGIFISPYRILPNADSDQLCYGKKIVELEKKRVDYAIKEQEHRLNSSYLCYKQWIIKNNNCVQLALFGSDESISVNYAIDQQACRRNTSYLDYKQWILEKDSLVRVALFGSDEDISKELNWIIRIGKSMFLKIYGNSDIIRAIQACIKYPNKTNNALALLLSAIDIKAYRIREDGLFYKLLLFADKLKNKKAFAFLASNEPYNEKNLIWCHRHEGGSLLDGELIVGTNLDHMIKDGNFDQENIKIYIKHGGKTMKKVKEEVLAIEQQALVEEQRRIAEVKMRRKESQKDKGCTLF